MFVTQIGSNPLQQPLLAASRCPCCGNPVSIGASFYPAAVGVGPFPSVTSLGGVSPLAAQVSGLGVNPWASVQAAAINPISPLLNPQFGAITTPVINPLVAAQFGATHPALLSQLTPQIPTPFYAGTSPLVQSPLGAINPYVPTQFLAHPAIAADPMASALLAHQLSPLPWQQLPIRPLIGPQPVASIAGIPSPIVGQPMDPYSALAQAQLISQLTASPFQQLLRAHTPWVSGVGAPFLASPLIGTPFGFGVPSFPSPMTGIPFGF